ncbi:MAG TPA: DUF692 domain-containing protein [Myxococcota bacterium]|nr:DUF692 domain-containing protein [Myxococcota bacterium]
MSQISSGLEWDMRLERELFKHARHFDAIEVIPENFFFAERIQLTESLRRLKATKKPILFHGVELSIGSSEPLKRDHLSNMMRLMEILEPTVYSEHLSMTEASGVEIGQLTPLLWTKELADYIAQKIRYVQASVGIPFLIENISNRFVLPYTEITETNFINRILNSAKCGLLLDITNVLTNSVNYDFDPYIWIDALDLSFVRQIHLAGGARDSDNVLEDSHDQAVWDESWQLYAYVIRKLGPIPTVIERTGNIPQFDSLVQEAKKARQIQETYGLTAMAA